MKQNRKYVFLTAEELAHRLTYGKKKTYDFTLIRKLDKRLSEMPDMKLIRRGEDFAEYSLPKKWIKVSFPRQYSDEQRAEFDYQETNGAAVHKIDICPIRVVNLENLRKELDAQGIAYTL